MGGANKRNVLAIAGLAVCLAASASAQDVSFETGSAADELRAEIRAASLTQSLLDDDASTAQDFVAAARADYRRILTALYSAGHYGPEISIRVNGIEAASIAPLQAPSAVSKVNITVDPGPAFRFGQADIAPLPPGTAPPDAFASGEPARAGVARNAVTSAVTAWRNAGHAKAAVSGQTLRADHPRTQLDANITLTPGPQLTFGPLSIDGNEAVRTSAIARIAGLPEGAVYSPETLAQVVQRLRQTGAFDTVTANEADEIGPGDTLPISLSVSESKPRRFGFGLELSTIDGLTVSSFWMHRNAFGGAERFRVDGEISGIGGETGGVDYELATSLAVPAIYGPKTDFLASFTLSHEEEPTFVIDKIATEAQLTRDIGEDLIANVGIGLLRAREETVDGVRSYTLLTLPVGIEWDKRDSETNTKSGFYLDLDATPFIGLQDSEDGARIFADARVYKSVGTDDAVTFAARAQLGSLIGTDATDAPADFLFFSGGGGTVRGQPYNILGITDANDDFRGGTSFAGFQLETRVDVTDAISLVGFYDYGHVGDTPTPLQDGDSHAGAGIGLRYNTGIGPIRLDIGTPVTGSDAYRSVQVYIGIGQAF